MQVVKVWGTSVYPCHHMSFFLLLSALPNWSEINTLTVMYSEAGSVRHSAACHCSVSSKLWDTEAPEGVRAGQSLGWAWGRPRNSTDHDMRAPPPPPLQSQGSDAEDSSPSTQPAPGLRAPLRHRQQKVVSDPSGARAHSPPGEGGGSRGLEKQRQTVWKTVDLTRRLRNQFQSLADGTSVPSLGAPVSGSR